MLWLLVRAPSVKCSPNVPFLSLRTGILCSRSAQTSWSILRGERGGVARLALYEPTERLSVVWRNFFVGRRDGGVLFDGWEPDFAWGVQGIRPSKPPCFKYAHTT